MAKTHFLTSACAVIGMLLAKTLAAAQGDDTRDGRATLIPDTVLPVYSGDGAIRFFRAVASMHGPADPGRSAAERAPWSSWG